MKLVLSIVCCVLFFTVFSMNKFVVALEPVQEMKDDQAQVKENTSQSEDFINPLERSPIFVEDIFPSEEPVRIEKHSATVVRVVNGDTIVVNYNGNTEHIRIIGVDAPENRLSRKARVEALASMENLVTIVSKGIEAEQFIKNILNKGDIISIELDNVKRNSQGELLAYVFLANGKMLNEEILRTGHAHFVANSHNTKYNDRLLKATAEAKAHKRGLWE